MSKRYEVSLTLLTTFEPEYVELPDDCAELDFEYEVNKRIDRLIEDIYGSVGILVNDIEITYKEVKDELQRNDCC